MFIVHPTPPPPFQTLLAVECTIASYRGQREVPKFEEAPVEEEVLPHGAARGF